LVDRAAKLRYYFHAAGFLDGMTALAPVRAAFEAWDLMFGVSAAARRVVAAERDLRNRGDDGAAQLELAEAHQAFWRAAWIDETGLLQRPGPLLEARKLLEDERIDCREPLRSTLVYGLVDRFQRWAAERGGSPLSPEPSVPDAWEPRIGTRLEVRIPPFVVPADYPGWIARDWLERARKFALAAFDVADKKIAAAEREARRPGRPIEDHAHAYRRSGRWLALQLVGRRSPTDIATGLHEQQGDDHAKLYGTGGPCETCLRIVQRDLRSARQTLLPDDEIAESNQ
jgi:hypothetical protein